MKLIPRSKARLTQASARSRATPTPNVSHDPSEISDTLKSLEPSLRYFMMFLCELQLGRAEFRRHDNAIVASPSASDQTLINISNFIGSDLAASA